MKYKKYLKYKDSGIEWLGEIPEHWEVRKVKYIFKIGRGRVISKEELENNGKYPVFSSQTENNGILGYINTFDYDYPQLTWTTDGVNAGTIFLRTGKYNCTNICGTLKPIKKENLNFLKYSLQFASKFYKRPDTNGAKIMNNEMANIIIIYPPLSEQKAIASFLDKQVEKIDTLIKKEEELIKLLEEKKEALITKAVTKGLKNTKMKDSGIEWLGEIPEHWEIRKLKYLGEIIIGLTYSPKDIVDENDGILVLRASNLKNGKIVFDDNVFVKTEIPQKLFTKKNDILICTRSGSKDLIGKNALIDEKSEGLSFGAFLSVFRNTYKNTDIKFIFYVFNSQLLKYNLGRFMTTTINQLTSGMLKDLSIPLPPLQEQKQIAEYLDKKLSQIDKLIEKSNKAMELLKEKKESLITNAVTGKIDVRNSYEA